MKVEIIKTIEKNIEYLSNTPIEKWQELQIAGQIFSLKMLKKELEIEMDNTINQMAIENGYAYGKGILSNIKEENK
tara:strand:+ start:1111 stop:1338 length:228 start_codon:yes stop_codon:yes gene_type:complete